MLDRRTDPYSRNDAARTGTWLPFADLAAMVVAFAIAMIFCGYPHITRAEMWVSAAYFGTASATNIVLFYNQKIYDFIPRYFGRHEAQSILWIVLLSVALGCLAAFLLQRLDTVARGVIVAHSALTFCLMVGVRAFVRMREARAAGTAHFDDVVNVLVVGINPLAALYIDAVGLLGRPLMRVTGVLSERSTVRARSIRGRPILGSVGQVGEVLHTLANHGVGVRRLVVTLADHGLAGEDRRRLGEAAAAHSLEIEYLSDILNIPFPERGFVGESHFIWEGITYPVLRRAGDILVSALVLAVFSPIIAATVLLVLVDVGRPVLFWQERPGRFGAPFRIYKFRTMAGPVDRLGRPVPDERRTSWIGALIRRWRLDEFPQLANVLLGWMSIVGPRPLLAAEQPADTRRRLSVRPGLTGWAQVNGGRSLNTAQKTELDIWYTEHASLALDLKILFLTARMLLLGDERSAILAELALQGEPETAPSADNNSASAELAPPAVDPPAVVPSTHCFKGSPVAIAAAAEA